MEKFETKKFVSKNTGAIYSVDTPECLDYYLNSSEYEEYTGKAKKGNKKNNKKVVEESTEEVETTEESEEETESAPEE